MDKDKQSSPATETLLPCPIGCTNISPQHMYREICRDMQSPNWNKPVSRIWCPSCGISMVKEGIEEVRAAWNARSPDAAATPLNVTDEMLNAHLMATDEYCKPYEATRESGVPIECDISPEDADSINASARSVLRRGYAAALECVGVAQPVGQNGEPLTQLEVNRLLERVKFQAEMIESREPERLSVEQLARHFGVSVEQAKAAQSDIGFMYRIPAAPQAARTSMNVDELVAAIYNADGLYLSPAQARRAAETAVRFIDHAQPSPVSLEQMAVTTELFFGLTSFMEDDK